MTTRLFEPGFSAQQRRRAGRLLTLLALLIFGSTVSSSSIQSGDSGPRTSGISGLRAVVVGVQDMERSLRFYEKEIGMSPVSDQWTEFAGENPMLLSPRRRTRVVVLRHPSSGLADLRLVEIGGRPDPIRIRDRSWDFAIFDLGFAAEDAEKSRAEITAAGFFCKEVAQYHVPSDTRMVINECLCRGPDGEWAVVIQRPPPNSVRGLAGLTHSGISVRDGHSVLRFYQEGLGLKLRSETWYDQDGVRHIVGLPSGGKLRIMTLQSEADPATRVLLFEFSDAAGKRLLDRDLSERARPPHHGIYLLSFEVGDLAGTLARCQQHGGRIVVEPRLYESSPYGHARVATVRSPDGTLYELIEQSRLRSSEPDALKTAQPAFEHFNHGLATGEWEPFLNMLTDDFTFWFPTGKYHGLNVGKAKAGEFFKSVSEAFNEGLFITEVLRVTSNERTVMFEFRDEGKMRGEPYKNRVAISLDVCGDKICGYREYFGSDRKSN
ncbi:MAG: VOC family protein [Acidobacteria bacterium]|nr:VOC family protein [Acidobacteriota bacterium]